MKWHAGEAKGVGVEVEMGKQKLRLRWLEIAESCSRRAEAEGLRGAICSERVQAPGSGGRMRCARDLHHKRAKPAKHPSHKISCQCGHCRDSSWFTAARACSLTAPLDMQWQPACHSTCEELLGAFITGSQVFVLLKKMKWQAMQPTTAPSTQTVNHAESPSMCGLKQKAKSCQRETKDRPSPPQPPPPPPNQIC